MLNLEIYSKKPENTFELGKKIGKLISAPFLICLSGDLGTGKTCLTKGIGAGLNISENIVSPSFTLINEYKIPKGIFYHCDLYRLTNPIEILSLGLEDFLLNSNSIIVIEWADKLQLTEDKLDINLFHYKDGRKIIVKSSSSKYMNILKELENLVSTWN